MTYQKITLTDSGGTLAHKKLLQTIKAMAIAEGWVVLREQAGTGVFGTEIIMKGVGLSGTDEIFIGMRTYQNVASDIYNIELAAFTGFIAGDAFNLQPNYMGSGIPAHNQLIEAWLTVNPQRISFTLKVGNPVYVMGYVGKYFPYAPPSQNPYPVTVMGMFAGGGQMFRYSDTQYRFPFALQGSPFMSLFVWHQGAWRNNPQCFPYQGLTMRDTKGEYHLTPIEFLWGDNNTGACIMGRLDGLYHVSGYDNLVENTIDVAGVDHCCFINVTNTGFNDYYAQELA